MINFVKHNHIHRHTHINTWNELKEKMVRARSVHRFKVEFNEKYMETV